MAALVQSYSQQSSTGTMLQTRPMASPVSGGQQYMAGHPPSQRNSYHAMPGTVATPTGYRGASGPIQPYAFTSTPSLNTNAQWQQLPAYRTISSPAVPTVQGFDKLHVPGRLRHGGSQSVTNLPYNPSMGVGMSGSRDDSSIRQPRTVTTAPRPQSAYMSGTSPQLSLAQASSIKASPERYRRAAPQRSPHSAPPSGSGMSSVNHLYNSNANEPKRGNERSPARRPGNFKESAPGTAADDMQLYRRPSDEETKRLRRRSMPALDSAGFSNPQPPLEALFPEKSTGAGPAPKAKFTDKDQKSLRVISPSAAADSTMQNKNGSSESLVSTRSSNSRPSSQSANRNASISVANPSAVPVLINSEESTPTQDYPKLINIPPRGSSDVGKRVANPSPLSQPVTMASDTAADQTPSSPARQTPGSPSTTSPAFQANNATDSLAAKHLAAINERGNKSRSKTSRLRRAFSFGSAADFKKAAGGDSSAEQAESAEPSKLHKEPTAAELYDVEQARIARKQEEGGIGNSIYGAKLFAASNDNISISSTASSASIMIRKMGRGVKRSTRSLVGLFRPKSVVGAPAADALAPETSQASVSMVTAEAERERVNVNPDLHTQVAGGTGFPHLERNSIDTATTPSMVSERAGSSGTDNSAARRSIVGSDKERAEVLAAVRKGILKGTSGSSSPNRSAVDAKGAATFELPNVPSITDSPQSSAPSTPTDEAQGHKRSGSVAIGNEDYFVTALRLRQDTKSAPGTPRGTSKRNATFSPRIIFYDTWPSQEYDRRGEIATCNRLTPMLAQQIKEELNNFKMEMEVHETSKIYTHFF